MLRVTPVIFRHRYLLRPALRLQLLVLQRLLLLHHRGSTWCSPRRANATTSTPNARASGTFDNLLLISTFFLFSLPTLSGNYDSSVFPYTVPYLYPTCNTFMTCSIYITVGVAVNRYLDISDSCRQMPRIKSGYIQGPILQTIFCNN